MEAYDSAFQDSFAHVQDALMDPICREAYPRLAPLVDVLYVRVEDITSYHNSQMQAAAQVQAQGAQHVAHIQHAAQQKIAAAQQEARTYQGMADAAAHMIAQLQQNMVQVQTAAAAAQEAALLSGQVAAAAQEAAFLSAQVAAILAGELVQMPAAALALLSSSKVLLELTLLLKVYCTEAERQYAAVMLLRCSNAAAADAVLPAMTIGVLAARACMQTKLLMQLYLQQPGTIQQLLQATKLVSGLSGSAILQWQLCGAACCSFADVDGLIGLAIHLAQEAAAAHMSVAVINNTRRPAAAHTAHPAPVSAPLLLPFTAPKLLLPAPIPPAVVCDDELAACQNPAAPAAPAASFGPQPVSTSMVQQAPSPSVTLIQAQLLLPSALPALVQTSACNNIPSERYSTAASAPAIAASSQPQHNAIQAGSPGVNFGEEVGDNTSSNSNGSLLVSSSGGSSDGCCIVDTTSAIPKLGRKHSLTATTEEVMGGSDPAATHAWTIPAAFNGSQSLSALGEEPLPSAPFEVLLAAEGDTSDSSSNQPSCQLPSTASMPQKQQSATKGSGSLIGAFLFGRVKGSSTTSNSKAIVADADVQPGKTGGEVAADSAVFADAGYQQCLHDSSVLYIGMDSSTSTTTTTTDTSNQSSSQHASVEMPGGVPVLPKLGKLVGGLKSGAKGVFRKMHNSLLGKRSGRNC